MNYRRSEPPGERTRIMKDTESNSNPSTPVGSTGLVARLRMHHATVQTDADAIKLMEEAASFIETQLVQLESLESAWYALPPNQRQLLVDKVPKRKREYLERLNTMLGDWQIETVNDVNLLVP